MPFIKIHFKGCLGPDLSEWFQGMSSQALSPDESCLSCEVADNSAIYGVLSTLSSLGITLISVDIRGRVEHNST